MASQENSIINQAIAALQDLTDAARSRMNPLIASARSMMTSSNQPDGPESRNQEPQGQEPQGQEPQGQEPQGQEPKKREQQEQTNMEQDPQDRQDPQEQEFQEEAPDQDAPDQNPRATPPRRPSTPRRTDWYDVPEEEAPAAPDNSTTRHDEQIQIPGYGYPEQDDPEQDDPEQDDPEQDDPNGGDRKFSEAPDPADDPFFANQEEPPPMGGKRRSIIIAAAAAALIFVACGAGIIMLLSGGEEEVSSNPNSSELLAAPPTPTPTPIPTATPRPTSTPRPTATPLVFEARPTATPLPLPEFLAGYIQVSTPTPAPTPTITPTPTPTPTITPTPTLWPTPTPRPTLRPPPTVGPPATTPTPTPQPTSTARPYQAQTPTQPPAWKTRRLGIDESWYAVNIPLDTRELDQDTMRSPNGNIHLEFIVQEVPGISPGSWSAMQTNGSAKFDEINPLRDIGARMTGTHSVQRTDTTHDDACDASYQSGIVMRESALILDFKSGKDLGIAVHIEVCLEEIGAVTYQGLTNQEISRRIVQSIRPN